VNLFELVSGEGRVCAILTGSEGPGWAGVCCVSKAELMTAVVQSWSFAELAISYCRPMASVKPVCGRLWSVEVLYDAVGVGSVEPSRWNALGVAMCARWSLSRREGRLLIVPVRLMPGYEFDPAGRKGWLA